MNAWIVSETAAQGTGLSETLAQLGVTATVRTIADVDRGSPDRGQDETPTVVLLMVNRLFPPHLELIRRLRRDVGATVAVLSTVPHHAAILQAIRAGADDFIDLAADVYGELQALVARLRNHPSAGSRRNRLIVVIPCADVSDANILSANVAVVLARQFRSCDLLDLHVGGGDLAQLFGVTPRHTLGDLLGRPGEIDQAMFDQAITPHPSGVKLLAGPRLFEFPGGAPPLAQVQRVIALARASASVTVVNASSAELAAEARILAGAEAVVLTTRLDVVSLARTKQHLAFLTARGVEGPPVRVAALGKGRRGEIPAKDVQRVLGVERVECIPDAPFEILVSINVGEPLVLHAPRCGAARAIERLASSLMGDAAEQPSPVRTRRSPLGWFSPKSARSTSAANGVAPGLCQAP